MKAEAVISEKSSKSALRRRIKIDETKISDLSLSFKIAETKSELEQAFRLVHDAYAKEGYISPHPSKMRVSINNATPTATTVIGLYGDRVIMTISLFPDSKLGLPMDSIYAEELATLRTQKRRIGEVGALASDPDFRQWDFNLLFHMHKTMILYGKNYLGLDDFVITVNPKHRSFYTSVLLFEPMGELKFYQSVNQNPAVLLKLDLIEMEANYRQIYQSSPLDSNLHHFFFVKRSKCIHLPCEGCAINVWTEELIYYFFQQRTNLFQNADQETLNLLILQYIRHYATRLEQVFEHSLSE